MDGGGPRRDNVSMDRNAEAGRKWKAGALLAASGVAFALAMAFCGAAQEGPEHGHGRGVKATVSSGAEARKLMEATPFANQYGSGGSFNAGEAVKSALAAHGGEGWWPAQIAVLSWGKIGSSATPNVHGARPGDGKCAVALVVDDHGRGKIARDVAGEFEAHPSADLARRMLAFEALHEIGHCSAYDGQASFAHPALTEKQNASLAGMMRGTPIGDMWGEAYADSYAGLRMLEASRAQPGGLERAKRDAELFELWRKGSRHAQFDLWAEAGAGSHVTEMSLEELARNPDKWLAAPGSVEERAAIIASIGVARAVKASGVADELALRSFDQDYLARHHAGEMVGDAVLLAMEATRRGKAPDASAIGSTLAASYGELAPGAGSAGLHAQKAALLATEIAATAPSLEAALKLADRKGAGIVEEVAASLPANAGEISSALIKRWEAAVKAEKLAPSKFEDPSGPIRAVVGEYVERGEMEMLPGSAARPMPKVDLGAWRKARQSEPDSPHLIVDPAKARPL